MKDAKATALNVATADGRCHWCGDPLPEGDRVLCADPCRRLNLRL
jgi:hypothetical protein